MVVDQQYVTTKKGGKTASCGKRKPINDVCDNSQRNSCSSGNVSDSAIADTNTHYR